jgi:hypothetical protein
MRLKWTLLMVSLCANSAVAQGTLLFTWQNSSDPYPYQASFMVDHTVMGSGWSEEWPASDEAVMAQTVSFTDPWGNYYSQANSSVQASGQGNWASWEVSFVLMNLQTGQTVTSVGVYSQGGSCFTTIPGVGMFNNERGDWVLDLVPEPSTGSLLLLGGLVWVLYKHQREGTRWGAVPLRGNSVPHPLFVR